MTFHWRLSGNTENDAGERFHAVQSDRPYSHAEGRGKRKSTRARRSGSKTPRGSRSAKFLLKMAKGRPLLPLGRFGWPVSGNTLSRLPLWFHPKGKLANEDDGKGNEEDGKRNEEDGKR